MPVVSPYPHIVRESCQLDWRTHQCMIKGEIAQMVADTDSRAFAIAARCEITRPTVRARSYDLDYICGFTDYPMYLCGPNAPRITSFETAFAADYRDNPVARYSITIDDQDYLDTLT